jgi:hypothetical protein
MAQRWLSALWNRVPSERSGGRPRRPKRQRVDRYIECNWVSPWGDEQTRVSSISPTGCYIDSRFSVPPQGTHVREICLAVPDGQLSVHGIVLSATPGVGFAVRFAPMDDDTNARLRSLVGVAA